MDILKKIYKKIRSSKLLAVLSILLILSLLFAMLPSSDNDKTRTLKADINSSVEITTFAQSEEKSLENNNSDVWYNSDDTLETAEESTAIETTTVKTTATETTTVEPADEESTTIEQTTIEPTTTIETTTAITSAPIYETDVEKIERIELDSNGISNTNNNRSVPEEVKESPINEPPAQGTVVYITKTGEKYHTSGCSYLKKSKIEISLENAVARGYTPCSRCNPPTP